MNGRIKFSAYFAASAKRLNRYASALACLTIVFLVAVRAQESGAHSPDPVEDQDMRSAADPILSAMCALESARDAKCNSTACRFEDFVFGTPLSKEARDKKTELQKRLIVEVWRRASVESKSAPLSGDLVRMEMADILQYAIDPDKDVTVKSIGRRSFVVPFVRYRQYASIAYSYRALLAVQQESILAADSPLLPLAPDAVEALRELTDVVTVTALMLADEAARQASAPRITPDVMARAWQRTIPDRAMAANDWRGKINENVADEKRLHDILQGLITEKLAAYEAYNGLAEQDQIKLFVSNTARYYAKYPFPPSGPQQQQYIDTVGRAAGVFTLQLLKQSRRIADEAGRVMVRAADADEAVQNLTPHEIDDFEDVTFFPRLAAEDRIVLEAYDCDSLRDLGLHWRFLKYAMAMKNAPSARIDPFALEVITEAVSQYTVLLLRLAGQVAQRRGDYPYLTPEDVKAAKRKVGLLAMSHRAAPPKSDKAHRIMSSKSVFPNPDRTSKYFANATAAAGIRFVHRSSRWLSEFRRSTIGGHPTFSGGGVAAEDVNGDGFFDLLFVGGMGHALYLNDGRGAFNDVTAQFGINYDRTDGSGAEARQPIFADFDNDGYQDLLITYAGDDHRIYRNLAGRGFEDKTSVAGLGGADAIGGPATVFDFDGDGLLDIYVAYFGDYLAGAIPKQKRHNDNALPNKLFRQVGDFRFEDVSAGSGTEDTGWAQAVSHTDFDRDGRQDIIVANDFGRNKWLRNLGDGKFEDAAPRLGLTKAYHSMNVGVCDLNEDGFPDVYISNIATMVKDNKYVMPSEDTQLDFNNKAMATMLVKESNMLYMSRAPNGQLVAYAPSDAVERGDSSTGWAWNAEFFDFDHDGDDDLYVTNGSNDYNLFSLMMERTDGGPRRHYQFDFRRESNVFFVNDGGRMRNRSAQSGADFAGNSRAAVYFDADEDGDLDIAVNNFQDPAAFLVNKTPGDGRHWVRLRLIGDVERQTNRDAIGARVTVHLPGGRRLLREVQGGSGYLASRPHEIHFGTGDATQVDLDLVWPNGDRQSVMGLEVDRAYTLRQHDSAPMSRLVRVISSQP